MSRDELEREIRLRRLAAQLIVMLPENLADAKETLRYAEQMLAEFITPHACRSAGNCSAEDETDTVRLFPTTRRPLG